MKLSIFALLFALHLSAVEGTLNHRHVLHRRQSGSVSAAPASPPALPSPSPSSSNAGANSPMPPPMPPPTPPPTPPVGYSSSTASGSTTVSASSATPTGPPPLDTGTGIPPLANITMGMATKAPPSFTNTWRPGATPPVQGAPVLPAACESIWTIMVLALLTHIIVTRSGNWPARDQVPPTGMQYFGKQNIG